MKKLKKAAKSCQGERNPGRRNAKSGQKFASFVIHIWNGCKNHFLFPQKSCTWNRRDFQSSFSFVISSSISPLCISTINIPMSSSLSRQKFTSVPGSERGRFQRSLWSKWAIRSCSKEIGKRNLFGLISGHFFFRDRGNGGRNAEERKWAIELYGESMMTMVRLELGAKSFSSGKKFLRPKKVLFSLGVSCDIFSPFPSSLFFVTKRRSAETRILVMSLERKERLFLLNSPFLVLFAPFPCESRLRK